LAAAPVATVIAGLRASHLARGKDRDDDNGNEKYREDSVIAHRIVVCVLAAIGAALGMADRVAAQAYPERLIKMVVPYPAGGPIDTTARLLVQRLGPILGQTVIVENRGGAGGALGTKAVAVAEPDGYTLLFSSPGPLVTAAAIYRKLDYDPVKSFAPIAMTLIAPQMLVVHPSVPAKTLQELVAYAKARPGDVKFASSGYGTQPHMLGEMLRLAAGIDIAHVPYRGAGQSVTDVTAGQVPMIFEATSVLMSHVQSGRLRALAICTEERSKLLPDVPTTGEAGYPTLLASFWSGFLAPAGTPEPIVGKLNATINDILRSPEAQTGLARLNADVRIGSPQDFARFIAAEAPRWAQIAKAANIRID
jgi:tripartite-type tricarboxylate transporter receptor subunit TctC